MADKISRETVRGDFNDPLAVVHYTRAAHFIGLWESERTLFQRYFPDVATPLLEAGCGAGRVTVGLWDMGYRKIFAFDFAQEMVDQARSLAASRGASELRIEHADATRLDRCEALALVRPTAGFGGVVFSFNGLMQIPGRRNRRAAMRRLADVAAPEAPFLFTTHDRDVGPMEQALWRLEALRWAQGKQDPCLVEFGDRYFQHDHGRTFMHLPDRAEILEDLAATGWRHVFDALRREVARESRSVRDFSDECRFWVARRV